MISSVVFWRRLQRYPPILIRLLARRRYGRPLTSEEIAERSGLSAALVDFLSEHSDWTSIDIPTFRAFVIGCDVDLLDRHCWRRVENYMAGTKFKGKRFPPTFRYLKSDPKWESYYRPLIQRWLQHKGKA